MSTAATPTTQIDRTRVARAITSVVWAVLVVVIRPISTALIVLYPLVDVVFTVIGARRSGSRLAGGAVIAVVLDLLAVIAMAIATTAGFTAVFLVFGIWAALAGILQLVLAVAPGRRPVDIGDLLSGIVSTLAGLFFIVVSHGRLAHPPLLAAYAVTGAIFAIVGVLTSRRRGHSRL